VTASAHRSLDPVVEAMRPPANCAEQLIAPRTRLTRESVLELGPGDDAANRLFQDRPRERLVDHLGGAWALDDGGDQALQLAAAHQLIAHALDYAMLDERARELLGQWPCKRGVDEARQLGRRQYLLERGL
jgi:hypothetical protein